MKHEPAAGTSVCKGCGGTAPHRENGRMPLGWYGLTVTVPPEFSDIGYLWVGVFCGIACLAASIPGMAAQEELARLAYEPAPPSIAGRRR